MVGKGGFISMEWQTRGLEALPRYAAINVKESVKEAVREINCHHLNFSGLCRCPSLSTALCHILNVVVSQGCHDKAPQTGYLKIREMYALIALEARHLKSRCWQDHARRGSTPCFSPRFWHYQGSLPWLGWHAHHQSLPVLSGSILPLSSCHLPSVQVCLCVSIPLLTRTPVTLD